ncbi:MAG: NAD(P)-binding domain-containing protein, partial [Acidobacteria bacterium]|nr:NAD(P)-binding domain-containing protein [Acidobacteriota bacterium]
MQKQTIAVAGAGRLAQALAKLLYDRGEPVVAVASRHPERARAAATFIGPRVEPAEYKELPARAARLLLAVPDDAVASVAATLAQGEMRPEAALHTCGVYDVEVLEPLAARGVSCA